MKTEGLELIRRLSLAFGPTGYTDEVLAIVREELEGIAPAETDRMNVLTVKIPGGGDGYDPANPKKVLFSAHADEVGFLIVGIDDGGYLYFRPVGGIDAKVLCGRSVLVGEHKIPGVISAKAIHHMSGDERKKVFEAEDLYINIGAADKADAEKYVSIGDYAAFDSEFVRFGEDGKYIKCKALDDRLGCAVMIEAIRRMKQENLTVPYDLYFAFTDGEEIGCSLAKTTANRIAPDLAAIDPALYEAAKLDGASKFRQIWNITIPLIMPTIIVMLIIRVGYLMDAGFEQVYAMINSYTRETGEIIGTYVYRLGLGTGSRDYGLSTAVGLVNGLISLLLILVTNKISKKKMGTGIW